MGSQKKENKKSKEEQDLDINSVKEMNILGLYLLSILKMAPRYLSQGKAEKSKIINPQECASFKASQKMGKLTSNNNQAYKQFGNAVPVNVVREISKEIIKVL